MGICLAASWHGALAGISRLIDSRLGTTTVFLFGILFLLTVCIHLCTKVSKLDDQVKKLAQELALRE